MRIFTRSLFITVIIILLTKVSIPQQSVLINLGSTSCADFSQTSFSLIKDPLGASPSLLSNCGLTAQLPNFYYTFVAYNPSNSKVYIADTRTGVSTKIWSLDMGLPANINCPASIPVAPNYSYNYTSNNFEFDNNGDLWSLSNYNGTAGQCSIDKFDVNTGLVISTRLIQFPAGQTPTDIFSGDIIILPNNRMFAVLGTPSRLYEITNYSSSLATATYLITAPKNCFGLSYLNGRLGLSGFDGIGCYFYEYSISANTPSTEKPFQNGQAPGDNTAFSPSIGVTNRLLNSSLIDLNSADLTYEIYVRNMGNITLNELSLKDDLAATFGAANISNVSIQFAPGGNAGGLTLNPAYNGTNVTEMIAPHSFPNQSAGNQDYFFKILLHCTATNLNNAVPYLNSAVASAGIGNTVAGTRINVSDLSNNGDQFAIDPNNDGIADQPGENNPTPFVFGALPVHFLDISAALINKTDAIVKWTVATPTVNAASFEPQYSTNGINWYPLNHISITDPNRSGYDQLHKNIPLGVVFYRIKQYDLNGTYIYSRIVSVRTGGKNTFAVYPNPADRVINIISSATSSHHIQANFYDAAGRLLLSKKLIAAETHIDCSMFPNGTYIIKFSDDAEVTAQKIMIRR